MKRTKEQNKILHSLLMQLNIDESTKAVLVFNYTEGRTEHSSEMTEKECAVMIKDLRAELRKRQSEMVQKTNHLRREIFKLFYELNWIDSSMSNSLKIEKINYWLDRKTKFKSDLNRLSKQELETVIRQLRAIRRIYEEKKNLIRIYPVFWTAPTGGEICLN